MSKINALVFNDEDYKTFHVNTFDEIPIDNQSITWINVNSMDSEEVINSLEDAFKVNPLVIEDILEFENLIKIEDYSEYIFMLSEDVTFLDDGLLDTKQLSLLVFHNLIISIEQEPTDLFERISKKVIARPKMFSESANLLFIEIIESSVENYFDVLETIGEKIDDVEDELLLDPTKDNLSAIYTIKRDLISIRKTLWLIRNSMNRMIRNEYSVIDDKTVYYFRDIYDEIVQLIDLSETYRDICSGMLDIYLSSISNKTNDIMKVLTILSTIFIPLTFLAGIYGMNFKHFPEIYWRYGYVTFWILSVIITAFMIRFFKKKDWM